MKKFIKVNFIILVILCICSSCVFAETDENLENEEYVEEYSEEEEEEKDLDTLEIEKSELETELTESNSQLEFIQGELSATVVEVAELTQNIYDKQMEIETLTAEEEELTEYIAKAEEELEKSNVRYEKQKKALEKRLVIMYENGNTSYLEVLLNSKGITEFISNWYVISEIADADEALLKSVQEEKEYNQKIKTTLETKKAVLEASKTSIQKAEIALQNMVIIKDQKLQNLSEEELALQQSIEEYQQQITEIETQIRLLAIANVSEEYVGGEMAWPVPGYTRITSQFGMRTHPITGVYKLHTGVDIGAPLGASFIAANDGVVTYAGYNTAYGNMVIIDHGGGITTLYAHGSEILVSAGDIVYQGDQVLKVGSTGYSTGAHAHFEVRINGEYVNPLDYITSYDSSSSDDTTSSDEETTNTLKNEVSTNTSVENTTEDENNISYEENTLD